LAVSRHATRPLWAGFFVIATICAATRVNAAVGVCVAGVVCDTTGAPIQGVTVASVETGKTAVSDLGGRFELSDLPIGVHSFNFARLGYHPLQVGPVVTHEGYASPLLVKLIPKTVTLPQVDVYRRSSTSISADGVTFTLSELDWKNAGAHSVADALRMIPSVVIREDDRTQRISLRGSHPRAVHVDLDGIPLNDPGTGEADVSSTPLNQLAAVEVELSGDGGKVHLLTQKREAVADLGRTVQAGIGIGSSGRIEGDVTLKSQGEEWGGHVRGGLSQSDGDFEYYLDDGTRKQRYNNAERKTSGDAGLSRTGASNKVEIGSYYSKVDRGVPGLIYAAPTPEASYDTRRLAGRIAFRKYIGMGGVESQLFAQSQDGEFYSPARQFDHGIGDTVYNLPEWSRQSAERYGANVSLQPPFSKTALTIRYSWQLDRFIGRDLFTGRVEVGGVGYGKAERQTHHIEMGAKRNWWISEWSVALAPLLAGDYIEEQGLRASTYFSPSVLLSARRSASLLDATISLSRSKSFTPPPFNALFTVESMIAAGNRNLRPERGESIALNATIEPKLEGLSSSANVSIFRRETTDFIVWRRNAWGKYYPDNLGTARFTGAEISGRIEPSERGVALWFNYIYNRSRNCTPGDVNNGNFIPLTPLHSGSSGLTINRKNTILTLQGRWIGLSYSSESNLDPISTAGMGLPAYSVYDVNVSQSIPLNSWKGTIEAGVNNLLDRSYRVVERSPMPGRSYWMRLSLKMQ